MQIKVDITPTPRILRVLGDIPFDVWQCVAELTDNSIDAFKEALEKGMYIDSPRVDIFWSTDSTPNSEREIVIQDNGPGMDINTLQKAAKAGYSSNDPIYNLGLFGMGFNIATARLGDETLFLSATKSALMWTGIKIDFAELIRNHSFSATIINRPKNKRDECGTKIISRKLKDGVLSELKRKSRLIKIRLGVVYTSILDEKNIEIYIQGKMLSSQPHCIWSESRYVIRNQNKVSAVQRIDRDLGKTYFDLSRNQYLSDDDSAEIDVSLSKGQKLPENVINRSRRLKGWIGIQRYSDPTDFGIDFIRNGRKILIADKTIFGMENPETGKLKQEYPVELGTTVGGRIVGELHVDYLIPSYQKNGFDTTDKAWRITVDAIRGAGPILPKQRIDFGYDGDNNSPLGLLVNAYRRVDPGTKNLFLPNSLANSFAKEFKKGNLEYQNDEKWFKAAQEIDRERAEKIYSSTPVNSGVVASDDVNLYGPNESVDNKSTVFLPPLDEPKVTVRPINSERAQLISTSDKIESLSGKYAYGNTPSMSVCAWKVKDYHIRLEGQEVPSIMFQDGVEIDFFYDSQHVILDEYSFTPIQLLLISLAEKFSIRDNKISFQQAYIGLIHNYLDDERINPQALYERAFSIIKNIKESLPEILGHRFIKTMEVIAFVPSEEEELAKNLMDTNPELLQAYQEQTEEALLVLPHVTDDIIIRLLQAMPEEFLDGKLFDLPYMKIKFLSVETNLRLKNAALDKIVSCLKDALIILQATNSSTKTELIRNSISLKMLELRIK